MFECYSEQARRVIFFARYEASQYGSPYIETEHLLLGLIREDRALANRFIVQGRSIGSIRQEIESQIKMRKRIPTTVEVPLSQESKRILSYAAEEADELNHRRVGTEHLLLGILREKKCAAAKILEGRGVTFEAVREKLTSTPHTAERTVPRAQRPGIVFTVKPGTESIEIREVLLQLFDAWKTRDAKKLASLFHEEGQFVDAQGNFWIGRQDIERGTQRVFSSPAGATIRGEIEDIKCLGTDITVVTIAWGIGIQPQTLTPIELRMTVVLAETDEGYSIVRVHATEVRSP